MGRGTLNSEQVDEEKELDFRELCQKEGWLNEEGDESEQTGCVAIAKSTFLEVGEASGGKSSQGIPAAVDRLNLESDTRMINTAETGKETVGKSCRQDETGICRTRNIVKEKEDYVNLFTSTRDDKELGAPAGLECRDRGDASTSGMFVDGRQSGSGGDPIRFLEVHIPIESKGEERLIEIYLRMRNQGRHLEMILGNWRKVMRDEENRASLSTRGERENSGEQTHALGIEPNGLRTEDIEIISPKWADTERIFRRGSARLGGTAPDCAGGNNFVRAGVAGGVCSVEFLEYGQFHGTTGREKEIRAELSTLPTLGLREGEQDTLHIEGAQTLARVVRAERVEALKKSNRRKDREKEIGSAVAIQEQGIDNVQVPDRFPESGIVVMPGRSGSLDIKDTEISEQGASLTLKHGSHPLSEPISSKRSQGLYSLGNNGESGRLTEAAAGMARESTTSSTPDPRDAAVTMAPNRNQGVKSFRSIGTENIRGHGEIHMEASAGIAELKESEEGTVRTTLVKMEAILNQQGPDRIKFKESSGTFDVNAVGIGDIESERVGVSNEAARNTCHLNENGGLANGAGKPTFGIGGFKKLARLGLHKGNDIGNSPEQSEGDARTTVTDVAHGEEEALESLGREELQTWRSNHINDDTLKTTPDHQTQFRAGALEGGCQDANVGKDYTVNRVVLKVGDSRGAGMARLSDSVNGSRDWSASTLGVENKRAHEKMERVADGWTEEEDVDDEEDDVDYTPSQEAFEFQGAPSESEEEGMGMERGVEDFEGLKFKISDGFWELGSEIDEEELVNDDEEIGKDRNMSTEEGEDAIVMDTEDQAHDVNQGEGGSLSSRCLQGLPDTTHQRIEWPAIKSPQPSSEGDALSKRTRSGCSLVDVSLELLETRLSESEEMDYFETVNDEEEYQNFLTAVREVADKSKEQELEEDAESEDDDEDFDIELQEDLESAYETKADSEGRKRKRIRRPETREKRRQRARLQLRINQQYAFSLPSSLPYVIPANSTIAEGTTKSDKLFNVLPLNAKRQPEDQGFTAHQIGQLYCLIHEHVQLLVQIFAVCLFDPAHQHLSPKLYELLKELSEAREKSIAMKNVPFPDFCFRPPYTHPSVHEEEQDPVSRKASSVCSDVPPKVTDIDDSWPSLFIDAGFAQQSPEACLRVCPSGSILCQLQSPHPSTFVQNSSLPSAPRSVGIDSSDYGPSLLGTSETEQSFKVGNNSGASTTEVDHPSAPSPLGKPPVCSYSASNPPTTLMEKGFTGPFGIDPPSSTLTSTHFDWAAYVHGQVQSLLDVAPLSLLKDFLSDISTIADDYKKKYGERGAYPEQCEWVPLFPVKMPSSQGPKRPNLQNPTLNLVLGTLTPVPDSKPFVKKTMAAALVESTKRQSLVLVPKAVAEAMLRFFPLFNKAMYPHKAPRASTANRLLFTDSEDELLAMGLMVYNTDWEAIQHRYLPSKSTHQIFVRQKNRSSARAPDNSIKAVRRMKASLLTLEEIDCIQEALKIYKYDWAKVWECCVPYRDPTRLPRQWRNSINIHKPNKSIEDNRELCNLTEGEDLPTPMTPKSSVLQIKDGARSFFPANTMDVGEDFNVEDYKGFPESVHPHGTHNADRITQSTTSLQYSGKSWSPAPLTPKSSDGKSKQCKKGTPIQAIPPPLLSIQPTARLVQTAALGLQNPFVPPKYPTPRRRFKTQTVKLAPGLPSLKLPSSVRVLSQSDAETFPGFFNSKFFGLQPLLPASPWSPQGPDGTGFSIQKIVTTGLSPRTTSGRVPVWAYEGDGLPVHGKRKSSDDFAVPNIMRKKPGLLHSRLGEDITYPANASGSQAEGSTPKSLVLFGKTLPIAQQSGQLHSARKNANAFSSGGLPPATQQSKSASTPSFLPTLQYPYWLSNSEAASGVGLDNLNEGGVSHKPRRGHPALNCTGTKSQIEMANPISQLLVKRKSGKRPSQQLQKQKSKAGASKHMLVHSNGLNEEVREDRGTMGRKTGGTLAMQGAKKRAGLTGELIRCIRKKVVATEWGVSKKELALKEVPIIHSNDRQQFRETAVHEDVSHPSGPDQSHMMTFVEGSGRASRTRRLRGAGIRVVVPRVTKRKETRREQEMHADDGDEEPFFEPHQIVMEQEELGTSDYDNSEDVIESVQLVKPPSVRQNRRNGIRNRDKHSRLESSQSERKRAHEDAPSRPHTSSAQAQTTQLSGSSDNQMPQSTQWAKEVTPFHKEVPSPPEEVPTLNNVVPESDDVLRSADIPSSTSPEEKPLIEPTRRRDVRIPSRFYLDEMLGFWPRPRHVKQEGVKGREEISRSTVGRTSLKRKGVKALMEATETGAGRGKGKAKSRVNLKKRSRSMQQMREYDGSADGTPGAGMEGDRVTDITSASGHSAIHGGQDENGPVTKGQQAQDATALEAAEVLTVFSQKPSKQKKVASKQQG